MKRTQEVVLGLTFEAEETGCGVVIAAIQPGYPAARRPRVFTDQLREPSMQPGDVVLKINGQHVEDHSHAGALLRSASGVIRIEVERANARPRDGFVTPWLADEPIAVPSPGVLTCSV